MLVATRTIQLCCLVSWLNTWYCALVRERVSWLTRRPKDHANFFATTKFFSCLDLAESQELLEASQMVHMACNHACMQALVLSLVLPECPVFDCEQSVACSNMYVAKLAWCELV